LSNRYQFIEYYDAITKLISKDNINDIEYEVSTVKGLYDDIEGFKDSVPIIKTAIKGDIMNDVILQDKDIQKIDVALEKIMMNGNANKRLKSKKKQKAEADDDTEEYVDDYDGNEWDD
jgi:hypothetical protein